MTTSAIPAKSFPTRPVVSMRAERRRKGRLNLRLLTVNKNQHKTQLTQSETIINKKCVRPRGSNVRAVSLVQMMSAMEIRLVEVLLVGCGEVNVVRRVGDCPWTPRPTPCSTKKFSSNHKT